MYMWHLLLHWYAVRYCRCRPKVGAVWVWCRCKVHGDEVGLRVAVNALFLGHFISFLIPLLCLRAQMEKTIKHHTFTPWWGKKKTSWLDFCTNNRPQQKKPWRHNFPVASNVLLHNTLHEVGMFTRIWTFFWLEHGRSWANIYTFGWWNRLFKGRLWLNELVALYCPITVGVGNVYKRQMLQQWVHMTAIPQGRTKLSHSCLKMTRLSTACSVQMDVWAQLLCHHPLCTDTQCCHIWSCSQFSHCSND